jgi:hypothetical protein
MCILFHKWGKWKQYTESYSFMGSILAPKEMRGKTYKGEELRQRRTCSHCGKMQDKLIKD